LEIPQHSVSVTYLPIDSVRQNPKNARTHTPRQIRKVANSLREFGFINPIIIDKQGQVVAGHARLAAAQLLHLELVPTIAIENLTATQIRAYVIADNRLALDADWDAKVLAEELGDLLELANEIDVSLTGFEVAEIDELLCSDQLTPAPEALELDGNATTVTQTGDLWQLDEHRVLCANSLQDSSFDLLMAKKRATVTFADPPYNVRISGNVCGKGTIQHPEFAMASGEMNEAEFTAFLSTALRLLVKFSTGGSVHFVCMDWRSAHTLLAAGRQNYDELLNMCVWVKDNGGMGSFYRSQHELVFVFRNGKERHRNNIQLGRFGRNRTNVWRYPCVNTLSRGGEEGNLLALHPTVKPVTMVADALLDCSARGDIVLDPFLGSGSTLIAAERIGRVCYGIEIEPRYVDVAIRRWQAHTGSPAIHLSTGKTFDELSKEKEVFHG